MRHTVLIIDDDPLLVTLQKKLTQRIGPVDVAHADDGFQALHFLAEIEPDIAFLDIDMPGLDGWLLCEILHKVDRGPIFPSFCRVPWLARKTSNVVLPRRTLLYRKAFYRR